MLHLRSGNMLYQLNKENMKPKFKVGQKVFIISRIPKVYPLIEAKIKEIIIADGGISSNLKDGEIDYIFDYKGEDLYSISGYSWREEKVVFSDKNHAILYLQEETFKEQIKLNVAICEYQGKINDLDKTLYKVMCEQNDQ